MPNRAILTDDGILIQSQAPVHYQHESTSLPSSSPASPATSTDSQKRLLHTDSSDHVSSAASPSSSTTSSNSTSSSSSSGLLNSLLGCFTCFDSSEPELSDDLHDLSQLPANSLIPYTRILNAEHVGRTPYEDAENRHRRRHNNKNSNNNNTEGDDDDDDDDNTKVNVDDDDDDDDEDDEDEDDVESKSVSASASRTAPAKRPGAAHIPRQASSTSSSSTSNDRSHNKPHVLHKKPKPSASSSSSSPSPSPSSTSKMKTRVAARRHATIRVTFAKLVKNDLVPKRFDVEIDLTSFPNASSLDVVSLILDRSYVNAKRNRSMLVIINPHGGKGSAKKLYMQKCHPLLAASKQCTIDIAYTKYAAHAIDIARDLNIDKYDTIVCASGDGIPHEVLNGLYQRKDRAKAFDKLCITQLPCGSGNAMSVSCHWTVNPSYSALSILKSIEKKIDLMCVSQKSYIDGPQDSPFSRPRLSFLSQTYGIIAESDINTEFIRWMGPSRFDLGVAMTVLQGKKYPCDIYVKYAARTKDEVRLMYNQHKNYVPTPKKITDKDFLLKYDIHDNIENDPSWDRIDPDLTENVGIFYTGKLPYVAPDVDFFPASQPDDGVFDLVITDARTSLVKITNVLLSLDKGLHVQSPEVLHAKITALKIVPRIPQSLFSVDGEMFELEPMLIEVLPRVCNILLKNGTFADSGFDNI
ncbi:hypothetical protein TBLA_0E03180 [Henningerozyma blattae CBS 6284]|uniref:sphingosine kinase n=1 Tax=Henningerozyma blattae (strain ATCC 34711 / CBS 6284 / DSM 70876 / NBRC 10599 / NRRL Y-10934 / UCD 77-7) TaxID=1071380 RepID=I2H4S0_HENB6|nr:hypothetical protein TBLA_0E03180 [Tetrapisispora blattae CBS 6284]CCH61372.1 hypothetical protein TBLA_0E03180 [Tetrapisispora blattae CBS 6284]